MSVFVRTYRQSVGSHTMLTVLLVSFGRPSVPDARQNRIVFILANRGVVFVGPGMLCVTTPIMGIAQFSASTAVLVTLTKTVVVSLLWCLPRQSRTVQSGRSHDHLSQQSRLMRCPVSRFASVARGTARPSFRVYSVPVDSSSPPK